MRSFEDGEKVDYYYFFYVFSFFNENQLYSTILEKYFFVHHRFSMDRSTSSFVSDKDDSSLAALSQPTIATLIFGICFLIRFVFDCLPVTLDTLRILECINSCDLKIVQNNSHSFVEAYTGLREFEFVPENHVSNMFK